MSRVTVRDIGWAKVKADSAKLSGWMIEVGLFDDAGEHDGVHLAQIGFWQEFGTSTIPARPWLSGGAEFTERAAMRQITSIARRIGRLPGDPQTLLRPLAKAIAEGVKSYAINHAWTPNAPSTIAGKGFNWPLVETGEMIDAIEGRVKRYGRVRGISRRLT